MISRSAQILPIPVKVIDDLNQANELILFDTNWRVQFIVRPVEIHIKADSFFDPESDK